MAIPTIKYKAVPLADGFVGRVMGKDAYGESITSYVGGSPKSEFEARAIALQLVRQFSLDRTRFPAGLRVKGPAGEWTWTP